MTEPGRILVTGATGFLGAHLARAFAHDGRPMRVLVRRDADADAQRARGYEVARGDLLDRAALDSAVAEVDTIVHAAAILSADPRRESEIHAANATGTRNLVDAAAGRVRSLVLQSSIAVYGGEGFRDVDEDAPRIGASPYGASKIEAEDACRAAALRGAFECIVLRPCQIYGPGDRVFAPKVRALVSNSDHRIYGDPETLVALVHVDDVVAGTRLAVSMLDDSSSDPVAFRAYNLSSGETITAARLLAVASRAVGRSDDVVHPFEGDAMRHDAERATLRRVEQTLGRVRRPFVPLHLRDFTRSRHASIDRARAELGYVPAVKFDDTFEDAIRTADVGTK